MIKFHKAQKSGKFTNKRLHIMKKIAYNFSLYSLLHAEINALSYGLYHYTTTNIKKNSIVTEFELFFQNLWKDISNMSEAEISKIKTKLGKTCEKYCNIKVPYGQRKIVSNLSKWDDIVILKQDKGREW